MNQDDLAIACPHVDFTVRYNPSNSSYSIGDYIFEHLQKTFQIIKSSSFMDNHSIVEFVHAGIKDHRLPFSAEYLIANLQWTPTVANDFLFAQFNYFAAKRWENMVKFHEQKHLCDTFSSMELLALEFDEEEDDAEVQPRQDMSTTVF
jgi:hypothetical protein